MCGGCGIGSRRKIPCLCPCTSSDHAHIVRLSSLSYARSLPTTRPLTPSLPRTRSLLNFSPPFLLSSFPPLLLLMMVCVGVAIESGGG